MSELSVSSREREGVVLLYPSGFINAHTVRVFEEALQEAIGSGRFRIVLSGQGLRYVASAGLGALMGVIEEVRGNGGDIRIAELNETVLNIFEMLGFNHLYRIFQSEQEAVLSFRDGAGGGRTDA
ncbi:MAG TPA: STAS domain-containing protein [Vicinamibacteria bacterium]